MGSTRVSGRVAARNHQHGTARTAAFLIRYAAPRCNDTIEGVEIDALSMSSARRKLSRKRLAVAFLAAGLADALSIVFALTPPVQWAIDLATATSLFVVLGRQWILLPGLIMEAIPGLYVFPFWVLVVAAVAMRGTVQPGRSTPGP
jgi:hypothetical protein